MNMLNAQSTSTVARAERLKAQTLARVNEYTSEAVNASARETGGHPAPTGPARHALFVCVRDGVKPHPRVRVVGYFDDDGKLRPGAYDTSRNVQFPRAIRQEGAFNYMFFLLIIIFR